MDDLIAPFKVTYDGRDTSSHIIQADLFGESVVGAARFYTALAHYCMFGFVPSGKYRKDVTIFAAPSSPGSIDQWLHLLPVVGGQYALAATFYNEAFSYVFGTVADSLKDMWTRKSEVLEVVERLAETLDAESKRNAEVQTVLANGLVRANDNLATLQAKLIETLPALGAATRTHAVHFVVPIGVTCSSITQFADTPLATTITEPEALLIRGRVGTDVTPASEYRVTRVRELNLNTGHCIVDVQGIGEVTGEIVDPALETPDNVYTSALDEHTGCTVTAKAVTTNGIIDKLVISDARP